MKKEIFLATFLIFPPLIGEPGAVFSHNKQKILELDEQLNKKISNQKQGDIYYQLALAHYHDQEIIKGYESFLKALENISLNPAEPPFSGEEEAVYQEAFTLYIEEGGGDPIGFSKKICEKYDSTATKHPEYIHLNFLLSTAYANLGMYDRFFEEFYKGYPYFKETSLAHKTRGILLIRLAQASGSFKKREQLRGDAIGMLERALELNPHDPSLYKVLIYLAKESKQDKRVIGYLEEICKQRVKLSRGEIYPYVKEAIFQNQFSLAEGLIDLWQTWYPYSRSIQAAQAFLEQTKAKG